jgi:hypothetical protein
VPIDPMDMILRNYTAVGVFATPGTVDGLIYASSMVMLDSARRKTPVPQLARWLLGLVIVATLAANVVHGLGPGNPCIHRFRANLIRSG